MKYLSPALLVVILLFEVYDQIREESLYERFNEHSTSLRSFVEGWAPYAQLAAYYEADIQLRYEHSGDLEDFSCEAVFIRQHNIVITDDATE